jgi:S-adenosylmethionine-dependent methyltransferase
MSEDRNFEPVFEKFKRRIKDSDKGRLRGILIREDLSQFVQDFSHKSLKVLDAGCGLGDMSVWLAEQGHQVEARDLSPKMIAHTLALAEDKGLVSRMTAKVGSAQEALGEGVSYDLICLHAVLEWLAAPYDIPALLAQSVAPGGSVSLTVYNLHRSIFNSLIKGSFRRVLQGDFAGSTNPPIH